MTEWHTQPVVRNREPQANGYVRVTAVLANLRLVVVTVPAAVAEDPPRLHQVLEMAGRGLPAVRRPTS